jgi:hypothetical protein
MIARPPTLVIKDNSSPRGMAVPAMIRMTKGLLMEESRIHAERLSWMVLQSVFLIIARANVRELP